MEKCIFHIQALSALHIGAGQGVGVVDLPIVRAKATNLPIIPGSSLKGVLRDELKTKLQLEDQDIKTLFGPQEAYEDNYAGAIAVGDANLLLFPIRSFAGTVAFATCPYILQQYKRDMNIGLDIPHIEGQKAYITEQSKLKIANKIALEDLDIEINDTDPLCQQWGQQIVANIYPQGTADAENWQQLVQERFVILPDDIFSFLVDTATEVRMRIRINRETRIVKNGALWSEENLPAESVLWGVIGVSSSRNVKNDNRQAKELAALVCTPNDIDIQLGGKHTVGRGFCRMIIGKNEEK